MFFDFNVRTRVHGSVWFFASLRFSCLLAKSDYRFVPFFFLSCVPLFEPPLPLLDCVGFNFFSFPRGMILLLEYSDVNGVTIDRKRFSSLTTCSRTCSLFFVHYVRYSLKDVPCFLLLP